MQALACADTQIVLLARSHPTNWLKLQAYLTEAWKIGQSEEPTLEFAPPPDFSELRGALDEIEKWSEAQGPWGAILAARARELELEAQMAEIIGDPQIRDLARRRFSGANAEPCRQLARRWARVEHNNATCDGIRSDDGNDNASLYCQMRRELEICRFSFPIVFEARLAAHAVVDDKRVWLKPGVNLRSIESRRIVLHEVYGHVVRRVAVQSPENWGYSCGVIGADADEEGRALWLEEKAGLLDSTRKAELGRRHLAADACRNGATFCEAVRLLVGINTTIEQAIRIVLRVWRGGGIAREIIYLDAYCRAKNVLNESSGVDTWMKRGQLSFEVASCLAEGTLRPFADN